MKKIMMFVVTMFFALSVFASPTPKQVEAALAANNMPEATMMIQQVLKEHPDSARAHLLNAYLLVHAQHNKAAANTELNTAVGLDKKGDVKNSPLFGRVVGEISAQQAIPVVKTIPVQHFSKPTVQHNDAGDVLIAIIGFGVVIILIMFWIEMRKPKSGMSTGFSTEYGYLPPPTRPAPPMPYVAPSRTRNYDEVVEQPIIHQTVIQRPVYATGTQDVARSMGMSTGLGVMGTMGAVAGGVVAGELLHDALTHRSGHDFYDPDYRHVRDDFSSGNDGSEWGASRNTYAPQYDTTSVSTEVERQSFSSGNDNNWGGNDYTPSSDSGSSFSDSGSSDW